MKKRGKKKLQKLSLRVSLLFTFLFTKEYLIEFGDSHYNQVLQDLASTMLDNGLDK